MPDKIPHSPFTTRLSGSAKEIELRIRNIFQWEKKHPPVILFILTVAVLMSCFGLVSCQLEEHTPLVEDKNNTASTSLSVAPLDGDAVSPDGSYEIVLSGKVDGVFSGGFVPPEYVQICSTQTDAVLWEIEGLYTHAVSWSPSGSYLALARTARTYCTVTFIDTKTWRSWDMTLPDGSAIPEYTFLPDEWCMWLNDDTFLLTVGRDAAAQAAYYCRLSDSDAALTGSISPAVTTFKVSVRKPNPVHYDPMGHLTQAQKDLLADLPVGDLPRQAVDLKNLSRSQVWQNTLIPFFHDSDYDVTFYGIVSAESSFLLNEPYYELITDGIVLRVGDHAVYTPIPWYDNAHWRYNPWVKIQDFDSDGKLEAALCTHIGRGTGISEEALVLFDLDTLTYTVPDFTTLDIDVTYAPATHTATLSAGKLPVTVPLETHLEPLDEVVSAYIVDFFYEDGQIYFHTGLDFSGRTTGYLVQATAPVIWNGSRYCLGAVTELAPY